MSCAKFKRREGTAAIFGHLYETKLLSLIYFRAIHDDRIAEFQLASNVADVGAFDDICFKATVDVDGFRKSVLVFIQAKHKGNKKQTLTFDLTTYFFSYLKIRQHFVPSNKDLLFGGTFAEPECLFVLYTTARDEFSNEVEVDGSFFSILNDLIGTGGTAKRPYNQPQLEEFLCKIAIEDQITSLATRLATFIMKKVEFQQILSDTNDNIMLRYHVILAQKVLEISKIQDNGHRIATFRHDFFDNNEEYLPLFRDTLFMEILKKREQPSDIKNLLSEFIDDPNDAEKLSKLIGTVITYSNGLLEINKQNAKYRPHWNQTSVSRSTVDKAVELAAKEILLSPEFELRVPAAFGNQDITVVDISRIDVLTSKMSDLLKKCEPSKTITIDESLEPIFLELKGGWAGAIGNIFVLDDNTKLMKITDNGDAIETYARRLYENLNEEIPDLCEYKFCFKGNKFPKLLLEFEDEENFAKDFLKKLIIYSNQADEKSVETKLREEIEENLEYSIYIKAKSDAMFLKYHNDIQAWWMIPKEADYLTKQDQIFQRTTSYIIEDPLMISISVPYIRKIKEYNYTFTEKAVRSLNLHQHSITVIVTENSVLTIVKVMQHLKNKDHVVLDFEEIVNLPTKERNELRGELTNTNKEKVVILVCNNVPSPGIQKKTLENVAEAVRNKKTIIITNDSLVQILQAYFAIKDNNIVNDKNCLIDMSEESQKIILKNAIVDFEGIEVELEHLVSGWPQVCP